MQLREARVSGVFNVLHHPNEEQNLTVRDPEVEFLVEDSPEGSCYDCGNPPVLPLRFQEGFEVPPNRILIAEPQQDVFGEHKVPHPQFRIELCARMKPALSLALFYDLFGFLYLIQWGRVHQSRSASCRTSPAVRL